ncbi:MAG: hypothetical protein AAGD25_35485 [Cyanobacteria bacterium P01_F01_bin.150]
MLTTALLHRYEEEYSMAWNTSIIGVQSASISSQSLANILGYSNTSGNIDFESATSSMFEGVAFAEHDGWVIGISGVYWADIGLVGDRLAQLSSIDHAIVIMTAGVSDTFSFDDVRNGILVRRIVVHDGQVIEELGSKTAIEIDAEKSSSILDDGEAHILAIFSETVAPIGQLLELQLTAYKVMMDNPDPSMFA